MALTYSSGLPGPAPNPYLASSNQLDPATRQRLIEQADENNGGFLSKLFWYLDTPGAMARAGLAGNNPLTALAQSSDERIDGRELARQYGLAGDEDNWLNFAGGLATEVVTDPLAWLTGATKALTPAGRAAAKAGLMHQAPQLLSKAYLAGRELHPELASRAESALAGLGKTRNAISATDVVGRPLVGRRAASRYGTLEDLIYGSDAPDTARQSVLEALGNDEAAYEALRGKRLGRDIGIGLPLRSPFAAISIPGGTAINDSLDALGSIARWTPPGLYANALTNNAVGQATDAESQMIFQGADAARRAATSEARKESAYRAAKLFQEEPDVFSEEGNRALGRLIEKPTDNVFKDADTIWDSDHPAARAYREWWDQKAKELPEEFAEAGLRGATFEDPFISGYLPRKADGMLQQAGQNNQSLGRVLRTLTSDQMRRSPELMVPGGRDVLAFDLSKDPMVAGSKRLARTDQEAAQHIATKLYGNPVSEPKQSEYLAQLLHRLPDHIIKDVPLFGQHPVASISQYIEGRAGAKATVNAIYDSLAGMAAERPANLVEGGGHISLSEAINRLGSRTTQTDLGEVGARTQMRERLAQRLGVDPDKVDLSSISVPEDHVNRLLKVRESYTSPEAAQKISEFLDWYTRAWKAGVLSWPSRIVRDLYSGAYSNWLEGAYDRQAAGAVKTLLSKSAFDPEFIQFLKSTPRYASVADNDVAARFYSDLAGSGLIDGSYMADRRMAVSGGQIQDMLVGTTPETFGGALSELKTGWDPRSFFNTDTNPIARAGARAGNVSDKINRMTGYLSLIKQGVSPDEAARRMKRAHVDYSSLTPIEKKIRDNVLPFYAYTSRIFKEVMRQLAEQPGGRYGQGIRAYERAQESDQYVPDYMRQQFAAPIDPNDPLFGWLGIDPSLGTRYFTNVDLPGMAQLQTLSGSPETIAGNVLKMTHPLIRTGAELTLGRDFFMGEPINESSRSYGPVGKLMRASTGDPNAGSGKAVVYADKLLDLAPYTSRSARLGSQLYDSDVGLDFPSKAVGTAINTAGIGRLRDVTPEAARRDVIRKLQKMAAPYTREVSMPYIQKGSEAFVPQTAQDALKLSREMQNANRQQRRGQKTQWHNPFE